MDFEACLKELADKEGSDLYYSTGAPPSAKFFGTLNKLSDDPMKPGEVEIIANSVMNEEQRKQFAVSPEMNLAISRPGLGRYRVNIFKQRNQVSMVIRRLGNTLRTTRTLGCRRYFRVSSCPSSDSSSSWAAPAPASQPLSQR
jgi:twitching motility protein PilU